MSLQSILNQQTLDMLTNTKNWLIKNSDAINKKYTNGLLGYVFRKISNNYKSMDDMTIEELQKFDDEIVDGLEKKLAED